MASIRLGVIGSTGRMGTALRAVLPAQPDIELIATLESDGSVDALLGALPDVVVDLSTGPAVDAHASAIVKAGVAYIIGATGYQSQTIRDLERIIAERSTTELPADISYQSRSLAQGREVYSGAPVLIVPNFSLGANLMIMFAARAARLMHSPVVVERHHQGKADAPSGTALFTARRIAEARDAAGIADRPSTAAQFHESDGAGGALGMEQASVAIHALRGTGYLADQEVSFCLPGESLRIEHRSIDRACFMPGVLYAIRNIGRVRGLRTGLDSILEDI